MKEADDLTPTARRLFEKYGRMTIEADDLAKELHYKTKKSLMNAISNGDCPVPTRLEARKRVADIRALAMHLDNSHEAATMEYINEQRRLQGKEPLSLDQVVGGRS